MTKPVTNFAASARARLLIAANKQKGDFQLVLQRYAAERFLYRLGVSPHRNRFVLKGAMLFVFWGDSAIRPTRDLDLAGYGVNDAPSLLAAFREICSLPFPRDGLEFALDTLEITPIRDATEDHGFRINHDVRLAGALIPFQVDVGFGDTIVPEPVDVVYPVLLDTERPRIRAKPRLPRSCIRWSSLAARTRRCATSSTSNALASRGSFDGDGLARVLCDAVRPRTTRGGEIVRSAEVCRAGTVMKTYSEV